jgi:hypothetical protein
MDKHLPHAIAAQHLFKCRKCRAELFYDTHILYHGRNSAGTTSEQNAIGLNLNDRCDFEYYITPLNWMAQLDDHQGKVSFHPFLQIMLAFRSIVLNAKRNWVISIGVVIDAQVLKVIIAARMVTYVLLNTTANVFSLALLLHSTFTRGQAFNEPKPKPV